MSKWYDEEEEEEVVVGERRTIYKLQDSKQSTLPVPTLLALPLLAVLCTFVLCLVKMA